VTESPTERREREAEGLTRDVILAAVLTLPVFVLEMGVASGPGLSPFH
jgi:hypothetical protein